MTTTDHTANVVDHVIGPEGSLAIRLATAELRLVGGDTDRVTVRARDGRGLPDAVIVETHDGTLAIREKHGISLSLGRSRRTIELDIVAPRGAQVTADIASGTIDADGLTGAQGYRTASGEIQLRRGGGPIELSTVSGDAAIELAGPASLNLRSVSGDIRVGGGRLDALRIQTTSGDVRVDSPLVGPSGNSIETLSGDVDLVAGAGIRVEARTVSGDLESELPHRSEGRMGRRTLIVGDGEIELTFRSVSGDLHVWGASSPMPQAPTPPTPPAPPAFGPNGSPPSMPPVVAPHEGDAPLDPRLDPSLDDERMTILRSLERGELDVASAMDRLAALDDQAMPDEGRSDV